MTTAALDLPAPRLARIANVSVTASSVLDDDADLSGLVDPFDPHLVVLVDGHLLDEAHVVAVEQRPVGDADDANLRVHRHGHRQGHAELLGGGALLERHAAVGDARVVERQAVDRHSRGGDRVGLLLV
jgi:hypothetical protein